MCPNEYPSPEGTSSPEPTAARTAASMRVSDIVTAAASSSWDMPPSATDSWSITARAWEVTPAALASTASVMEAGIRPGPALASSLA